MKNCAIRFDHVSKRYRLGLGTGSIRTMLTTRFFRRSTANQNVLWALNDVSFEVSSGEILGMVGPNGAGKTTAIRLLMDIIRPDSGQINILGIDSVEVARDRIGYLPEERGLYRKVTVTETLEYLARLKGLDHLHAKRALGLWLDRVGMTHHSGKKIEQLSKGMGQIIQLVATIIHDPDIIILDEPFS